MVREYLSIQDAADEFGVDYKTIYRLVRAGKIAAGKIGGMYRIPREELDAYFQAQIAQVAGRDQQTEPAKKAEVTKCGYCLRLIASPGELGGECSAIGCDEAICRECWEQGRRDCIEHQPSDRQQLVQAQQALARGEIPCLVTALEARQIEKAWIARFDERIQDIGSLYHPGTAEILCVADWTPFHLAQDETLQLMRLLNVGYLDRTMQAAMPHNEVSRYHIEIGKLNWGSPRQALVLEARCVGHLETFIDPGFDTQPVDSEELLLQLTELEQRANEGSATCIVGLGSFTGWTAAAIRHIADEKGRAYRHRLLLPCLIDLGTGTVHANGADERMRQLGFAELFKLPLESEEIAAVCAQIEAAMLSKDGLSMTSLAQMLEKPDSSIRKACERLTFAGRYRLVKEGELGLVLLHQHD